MAGRGSTTFQKRQKEQQRKEKRAEKLARRQGRKLNPPPPGISDAEPVDVVVDGENVVDPEANAVAETGAAPVPE
jgi:ribose 5-phosphate isomerase